MEKFMIKKEKLKRFSFVGYPWYVFILPFFSRGDELALFWYFNVI